MMFAVFNINKIYCLNKMNYNIYFLETYLYACTFIVFIKITKITKFIIIKMKQFNNYIFGFLFINNNDVCRV